MQTSHTSSVDIVVSGSFTQTVVEFLQNHLLVGQIVPFAVALLAPFNLSCIVEQHRLTVAGGNHDAPFCRYALTLRM